MEKSLSVSADKGEQLLLLYGPLGKLQKTHYHGYLPRQTTLFFRYFVATEEIPVKAFFFFSLPWEDASSGSHWPAHLLLRRLHPPAPPKSSVDLGLPMHSTAVPCLCSLGAALHCSGQTLEMGYQKRHHSIGGLSGKGPGLCCVGGKLGGGKQWEKNWRNRGRAQVYWGGGIQREWGALHDCQVYFMMPLFFLSEQQWLEIP